MTNSRRGLLKLAVSAAVWLPIGLVIQGCAPAPVTPTTSASTLQQIITEGGAIANAAAGVATEIESIPGISSGISSILAEITNAGSILSTVASIASATSPVSAIMTGLSALTALLPATGLSANVQSFITAASSIAQVIAPLVGLAVTLAAPAPGTMVMDEDTAMATLLRLAAKK